MNERRGIGRRGRRWSIPLLGLIALLLAGLAPEAALAHPLDEYPQISYVTVAPTRIEVELNLTPGVLVAPRVLPEIDADGDRRIADAEARAYADAVVRHLALQVDGRPLALGVTKIEMPTYSLIRAGYGTIRLFAAAPLADGTTATHQISYANNHAPPGAVYQVNAFVEGDAVALGPQDRADDQQRMTVDYAVGGAAPAAAGPAEAPVTTSPEATGQAGRLLAYLDGPSLSPVALLLALGLAAVLGGLHALTPGHGKTLVAAYLVGSRGTVRHAVALGGIVTFTHTASVVAIGLLALFASRYVVPGVLVPTLEILSGLLVVVIGARLVRQRWAAFRRRVSDHAHMHDHAHTHDHAHGHDHDHPQDHGHSHGHGDGHAHSHLPPAGGFTPGSLVAMGVSGGLVPCPEALGIMVLAVGLNRIGFGLGLIVAFSVGLAAVLIAIGVLLVRSRPLVERVAGLGGRWSGALPLGSAAIVTALGVGIALNGLATSLG